MRITLDHLADVVLSIQDALTDDLRRPKYRGNPNRLAGHCYIASEAAYHLLGGSATWIPTFIRHESEPHWYLRSRFKDGRPGNIYLDITEDQFSTPVPHRDGKGKGFLTRLPSNRARILIARAWKHPWERFLG